MILAQDKERPVERIRDKNSQDYLETIRENE